VSLRLDRLLVRRGLVRSRSQGREFILSGRVLVDGAACRRPGRELAEDADLDIAAGTSRHRVGRGYDKLRGFLEEHSLDFAGCLVVDGGAATGGFTQLALERGARCVVAVDLGEGQLAPELRGDPRVIVREGCDLRTLDVLPAPCEILLLDLSGPSLREVLPALRLPLAPAARLAALVKPQFELPARARTGSGRVRDVREAARVLAAVAAAATESGWRVTARGPAPQGPDQLNREYFILARRRA
jgi:23S rRNA (cytidine1920-2'-O)/16S rRNA (cytidine1409-2'-O)-methyltransferase